MIKKIINFIKSILLALIYPDRVLSLFKIKNLDEQSGRLLANDNIVKIITFIAAFAFVGIVRYNPPLNSEDQRTITVPLNKILDESYTDFGSVIPSSVEVVLSGNSIDLDIFLQTGIAYAYVDLDRLEPGRLYQNVIISVAGVPSHISWVVSPSILNDIEISRIESQEFDLEGIIRMPELTKDSRFRVGNYTIYPQTVIIHGPRRMLDEINAVRVEVDFSDFEFTNTTTAIRDASIVPHNINLERVHGIIIEPTTANIQLEIYEYTRNIRININENIMNLPRDEYRVNSITSNISQIVVWGDIDSMNDVINLDRIDFRNLNEMGQLITTVTLPRYVYTEIEGDQVNTFDVIITVDLEEIPAETTSHYDYDLDD